MTLKRVLFFINSLSIGGAERVFVAQANELSRRGFDVHVATMFADNVLAEKLTVQREHLHVLNISSIFDVAGIIRLSRLVRSLESEVLYSTLNEANFIARLVKLLNPSLTLITREANMADIKPLLYKLGDWMLGFLSKYIFVVSRAVGKSLVSYAPWLRRKIRVIYNGVDLPERMPARVRGSHFKLFAMGTLMPKKDFGVLVCAMSHLPERYLLTVAGDGGERQHLEELAKKHALGRVTFLGWVAPDKTEGLYQEHDVFVLPSKYEGCPNVVSEAQSFGLPVVAFSIRGMDEFVDEDSGVLVKERTPEALADAIRGLCEAPGELEQKGAAGFEKVARERDYASQIEKFVSFML